MLLLEDWSDVTAEQTISNVGFVSSGRDIVYDRVILIYIGAVVEVFRANKRPPNTQKENPGVGKRGRKPLVRVYL